MTTTDPTPLDESAEPLPPLESEVSPVVSPPGRAQHRLMRWGVPVVALLIGIGAGVGIGAATFSSDPTQSKEYRALQATATAAQDREEGAKEQVTAAQQSADAAVANAQASLADREAAAASEEAAVSASAAALASQAQVVAQNTITEGTWTVGSDVQPGTYRTTAPVSDGCYWEITKTGTNGGDIVENDLPTGGYPTVTLSSGQDFTTRGCGDWLKQ